MRDKWTLLGYDTFAEEEYPLPGEFEHKWGAEAAAALEMEKTKREQPDKSSGGQGTFGIQDRIFLVSPAGNRERVHSLVPILPCKVLQVRQEILEVQLKNGEKSPAYTSLKEVKPNDRGRLVDLSYVRVFVAAPDTKAAAA